MGVAQPQSSMMYPGGNSNNNGYSSPGGHFPPHASSSSAAARRLLPWAGAALAAVVVLLLLLGGGGGDEQPASLPGATSANGGTPLNGPGQSDVRLQLGPYFFNPSVVRASLGGKGGGGKGGKSGASASASASGVYVATARTAHMKRLGKTNWWFNEAYVCTSARRDFAAVSCRKFDPWHGRFKECLWGSARKPADVDTTGLEDAKLFAWPGKGVYAVFGRKPEALGASPYCVDPVFVQFLVQLVSEDPADAWSIKRPRELKAGAFARQLYGGKGSAAGQEPIKEKNWMPFVHRDRLFMTHSVHPHRVFEVNSSGVAVAQHLTRNDALFAPFAREDVHGGPPVVLVPAKYNSKNQGSKGAFDYYLGVFHFFQTFGEGAGKVKVYHHYAYKTEAQPPFRVCAVSRELSLVTRRRRAEGADGKDGDGEDGAAGGGGGGGGGEEGWTHQRIWKDTSQTAYVAGLALVEGGGGEAGAGRGGGGRASGGGVDVLLSYGSSDIDARLLSLPLRELDAMFAPAAPADGGDQQQQGQQATAWDCSGATVIETTG